MQADGDDTSQKKLLNFYRNFNDAQPAWTLALSPRGDPRIPATGRNGRLNTNIAQFGRTRSAHGAARQWHARECRFALCVRAWRPAKMKRGGEGIGRLDWRQLVSA